RRWIACAHALGGLPRTARALASGDLGMDQVVELTRFATPEDEGRLITWARGVSVGAIRHKGDLAQKPSPQEAEDPHRSRVLSWWFFDEGRRFGLQGELPAAQGQVVARALDRLAGELPLMPGEEDPSLVGARRADALHALCSGAIAHDPDPDRATVVVHATLEGLRGGSGAELEGGPVIHPHTAARLLCEARIQTVIEDEGGRVLRVGRMRRDPPAWMTRQLKYRDRECR